MGILKKIKDKIARIFSKDGEYKEKNRKACEARKPEPEAEARAIVDWLYKLWQDEQIKKFFRSRKKITVFGASFYGKKPRLKNQYAWAVIQVERDGGKIIYREEYMNSIGSASVVFEEFGNLGNIYYYSAAAEALAKELADGLHPDYISQFAAAIRTGEARRSIERSLR